MREAEGGDGLGVGGGEEGVAVGEVRKGGDGRAVTRVGCGGGEDGAHLVVFAAPILSI